MTALPVLIIGAGPVGLATAIELGMRGVRCQIIERHDRVGVAPRAKTTNVRSRTHFRRWGIADKLAAASPFGVDYPTDVQFVTRLSGHRLALFKNAFNGYPGRDPRYPEHAQWIPQYKVESVLRQHIATLPNVEMQFSTEFLDARQQNGRVFATLRDVATEAERKIESQYLIGADGARSRAREVIGATMEGSYGLSRNYNVVFRAPGLAQAHKHGPGIMYWHVNPDAPALIGPMDEDDVWFFMPTQLAEGQTLSDEEAVEAIKRSTGIDLPYEALSNDEWVASRFLADKYNEGNIFLAGDACHLHPPFGGFGMNMGIGDAVDLGWKIAANLQGWGGRALLDAYATERRPVHQYILDATLVNHSILANQLWRDGLEDDTAEGAKLRAHTGQFIEAQKAREFVSLGAVIGYRYENSPVIIGDGSASPPQDSTIYVPTSRPGHVAPHAWLVDGSSLYDHFGTALTLLVRPDGDDKQVEAARLDAESRSIPLAIVRLIEPNAASLYVAPMTLVRPDQHVAWHGTTWSSSILSSVTGWPIHDSKSSAGIAKQTA